MVPQAVLASGWIPFLVVLGLALLFSTVYLAYYRSVVARERSLSSLLVSVLALALTLLSTILVPADVCLVSMMKNADGSWADWAANATVRADLEHSVLYAYYAFYSFSLFFAFLVLPMTYFFHLEGVQTQDGTLEDLGDVQEYESFGTKLCRALKYEALVVILLASLIAVGIFAPVGPVPPSPIPHNYSSSSLYELDEVIGQEFKGGRAGTVVVFLLNTLNVVGMVLLVLYTGYGMSSLPIGMIRGSHSVRREQALVNRSLEDLEEQITAIRARNEGQEHNMPVFERSHLERLEQQARLLRRTSHNLEQRARSCLNRIFGLLRPFQMFFGLFFLCLGFLIFVSLLLTSIDKAMHSDGASSGK